MFEGHRHITGVRSEYTPPDSVSFNLHNANFHHFKSIHGTMLQVEHHDGTSTFTSSIQYGCGSPPHDLTHSSTRKDNKSTPKSSRNHPTTSRNTDDPSTTTKDNESSPNSSQKPSTSHLELGNVSARGTHYTFTRHSV